MIGIRKRQPVLQPVSRLLSYPTLFLALLLLLSAYPILGLIMSCPQHTLSPFSQTYLSALPPTPEYLTKPLSEQRDIREQAAAALSPLGAAAHPVLSVVDVPADGPRPPVRVFAPLSLDSFAPVVLYVHGGGWVLSSVKTHDTVCRQIAEATKAVVVSVDYRLSPETPYPGPLDDCYYAYLYALTMRANGGGGGDVGGG